MQSAQASSTQGLGADFPAVDEHVHAGIHQPLHHLGDKLAAAEAVHQHAHRDPPLGGSPQGVGDLLAGFIAGEDVGLEKDFCSGKVDGCGQGRKELGAILQQGQGVGGIPDDTHQLSGGATGP